MKRNSKSVELLSRTLSYILVAAMASGATLFLWGNGRGQSKLEQLEKLIEKCFIGQSDKTAMEDAAAAGMVEALGDKWSYYIPASDYEAYMEQMNNAYVGIGVTVDTVGGEQGYAVLQVEPTGGAKQAGVQVGDILTHVDGQRMLDIGMTAAREMIRGKEGTAVKLSLLRDGVAMELEVIRQTIQVEVARGELLENNIGLVTIANFDERCAQETLEAIEQLRQQGATALIFDVRFNPGGYKKEMVQILDYLLPEGDLFRSVYYTGQETVDTSDADCLKMPMAVLINQDSYSAAEFFAAALDEYDWAVLVGENTMGKGYFQNTFRLNDGSAVGLSVGKYFTPNGVSLAEVGGLKPEIEVQVDETTAAKIYAGQLAPEEDPQIIAAIEALQKAS